MQWLYSHSFSHGRLVSLYTSREYISSPPPLRGFVPSHPVNPEVSNTLKRFEDDANQLNPSVVVIIIILAIVFFLSGCLHLLIRFLAIRAPRRDNNNNADNVTALQGQLQQLFHLHDSGVEQSFIDTLPVFLYKAVKGLKEASDCAVCLCEFEGEDTLRLLPKCSHAFHSECIDTWLLSHSTCPLCRASLLPDCTNRCSSPVFVVLSDQSGDESREMTTDREEIGDLEGPRTQVLVTSPSSQNGGIVTATDLPSSCTGEIDGLGKMVPIKLGKFRNIDGGGETSVGGSSSIDPRRCYSMGSYEYVLDPSNLQVFVAPTPHRKQSSTKNLPLNPGHRPNLSECMLPEQVERSIQMTPYEDFVCESKIIKAIHSLRPKRDDATDNTHMGSELQNKNQESGFSGKGSEGAVAGGSKSWIRSKRSVQSGSMEKLGSSRRAFSFRLPLGVDTKLKQSASRRTLSETELSVWEDHDQHGHGPNPSWDLGFNDSALNIDNCSSASSEGPESVTPSFAKRTLNWLVGRQKRVVHASSLAPSGLTKV
eukprot:Gb_41385 [translate_table: standard]